MALAVEVQRVVDTAAAPDDAAVRAWARAAWLGGPAPAEVVVRVTGEAESRELNRRYRGRDMPTNVLSFPAGQVPGLALPHIGDLVICAPVVEREADEQHKAAEAHWAHMVVHGLLHLQGYDHDEDERAAVMERLETDILSALGYPAPYPDEEMP